jgi:hypothetical protein
MKNAASRRWKPRAMPSINAEREADDQEGHERQLAHEAKEAADRQERLEAEAKALELNPPHPDPEQAKPPPG